MARQIDVVHVETALPGVLDQRIGYDQVERAVVIHRHLLDDFPEVVRAAETAQFGQGGHDRSGTSECVTGSRIYASP